LSPEVQLLPLQAVACGLSGPNSRVSVGHPDILLSEDNTGGSRSFWIPRLP